MTTLEEIRSEIIRLSGSGKRVAPNARKHGIYTSFTVPGLDDMLAVRDTAQRFRDFAIPDQLVNKTVLDVGCNVGAVSLEFARRGAEVVGVEYREDRVALCGALFTYYDGFVGRFYQTDLNEVISRGEPTEDWENVLYDIVWCSSVDEYVTDVVAFYRLLLVHTKGVLYLESNVQGGISESLTMTRLREAGASDVRYVGNGHSGGIARKRKLFEVRP